MLFGPKMVLQQTPKRSKLKEISSGILETKILETKKRLRKPSTRNKR
jgi:hypothetical protein